MADFFAGLFQFGMIVLLLVGGYALLQVVSVVREVNRERGERDTDAYNRYMDALDEWRAATAVQPDVEPAQDNKAA